MHKLSRLILFTSALLAVSLACISLQNLPGEDIVGDFINTSPTAAPLPTTAPPVVPTEDLNFLEPTPELIIKDTDTQFLDDFSDRESGWPVQYAEFWILDYYQGGYRISINAAEKVVWSSLGIDRKDVRMMVDARLIGGDDDNFFGVLCRYQDADNFYSAVISSSGHYAILARLEGGGLEIISGDQFTHSVVINPQMGLNLLEVSCIGTQIKLTVNGVLLAEVTRDELPSGDVGLLVGTFTAPSSDVLFDNFTLYLEE